MLTRKKEKWNPPVRGAYRRFLESQVDTDGKRLNLIVRKPINWALEGDRFVRRVV